MVSNIIGWYYFSDNPYQTSMHVPEPVISLAIQPQGQETPNFARALNRFRKEDPTFKVHFDNDSKEVCRCSYSIS
jgi:translation elongation factor EF-G